MILSIQALWLGCEWWDRTFGDFEVIWFATCPISDTTDDLIVDMDPCLMDGIQTFDLSRRRFGGGYN